MKTKNYYSYDVEKAPTLNQLINLVEHTLAKGWELQGGVTTYIDPDTNKLYFLQAVKL